MKQDYLDVAEFYLEKRVSKAGYSFDFFDSHWSLDNSLILNWNIVNKKSDVLLHIRVRRTLY